MRTTALVLLLALLATPAIAAPENDLREARALFQKNLDAIRNRDRDAYLATYLRSPLLARTGPAGFALGFAGLEATAGSGWPDTFEGRALSLTPITDGIVYATYRYRVRYGTDEQTGLSERLFVRTDDGWKIAVTTAFPNRPEVAPPPLALTGGTLVDGTSAPPLRDAVVVIRDGKIACAGTRATCEVPADADVVDTTGRWITPGLVDAHVHYSQTGWADARPDAIDVRARFPYDETIATLRRDPSAIDRQFLCAGVTSVLDAGGYSWTTDLGRSGGTSRVPNRAVAGPLLSTIEHDIINLPGEQQIIPLRDASRARDLVAWIDSLGSDFVKLWIVVRGDGLDEALREAVLAAGDEARRRDLRLIAHATHLDTAKLALRAGAAVLVHSIDDQPVDDEFLSLLKRSGATYVPTLRVARGYLAMHESAANGLVPVIDDPNRCVRRSLIDRIALTPEITTTVMGPRLDSFRERVARRERISAANLTAIHRAGGTIALGTDAGNPMTFHGPSVHAELEAMEAAGMSPSDVIVAATRNAARAMGRDDLGTVEPGKSADLLILRADPTASTTAFRALDTVILRGVTRTPSELDGVE